MKEKTLGNTDISQAKVNVPDLEVFGNGDMFKLISKASSQKEGWMKSTKACEIPGVGSLVQVTTQQRNNDGSNSVAEAVTFAPGVKIEETITIAQEGEVISRRLMPMWPVPPKEYRQDADN